MTGDEPPRDRFEYDAVSETFHAVYAASGAPSLSHQLVATVAAVADRRQSEVGPLSEAVDLDALETLLEDENQTAFVTFHLDEYPVLVYGDGEIVVDVSDPPDDF